MCSLYFFEMKKLCEQTSVIESVKKISEQNKNLTESSKNIDLKIQNFYDSLSNELKNVLTVLKSNGKIFSFHVKTSEMILSLRVPCP